MNRRKGSSLQTIKSGNTQFLWTFLVVAGMAAAALLQLDKPSVTFLVLPETTAVDSGLDGARRPAYMEVYRSAN